MTRINPASLKTGSRVYGGTAAKGVIDMATKEGNYVRVHWSHTKRPDILSRQSPLWAFLEVELESK